MRRVAVLFFEFLAPVLAGALVPAAPSERSQAGASIVIAAIVQFVVAMPISWTVAQTNSECWA